MESSKRVMRERWDRKAKDNAIHWVAPTRGGPDQTVEACYRGGKEEAITLLGPLLNKLGINPAGKRILDLGCGIGRLFPGIAELGFGEIWGADISPEMVRFGEQWCPVADAKFVVVDGGTLAGIEDNYFDFCFSRGTFPVISDENVMWSYLPEIHRTLVPGGVFKLDFGGKPSIWDNALSFTPAWARPGGRGLWGIVTLRKFRRRSTLEYGPEGQAGASDLARTIHSKRVVTPERVVNRLTRLGFEDLEIQLDASFTGRERFWVTGRKRL